MRNGIGNRAIRASIRIVCALFDCFIVRLFSLPFGYYQRWLRMRRLAHWPADVPRGMHGIVQSVRFAVNGFRKVMLFPTDIYNRWSGKPQRTFRQGERQLRMKAVTEWYVTRRLFVGFVLLMRTSGGYPGIWWKIGAAFTAWFALDAISYLINAVVLSESIVDKYYVASRTMILGLCAYFQLICGFAFVYASFNIICGVTSWGDALYFSIVTTATVGYGEMTPIGSPGRAVVAIEIVVMVTFALLFLGSFAARLGRKNET